MENQNQKITPELLVKTLSETVDAAKKMHEAFQRREARIRKREQELGLNTDNATTAKTTAPDTFTVTEQTYKRDGLVLKMASAGYAIESEQYLSGNTVQITFKKAVIR
jgi:hypothetical protein